MAAGVSVKSVVITGVGSIGLMAIPVARAAGATAVYAIDVNPAKLELAERAWAPTRRSWRREPGLVDEIKSRTNGDGVDVLLEMSGSGAAIDTGLQHGAQRRHGGAARNPERQRQHQPGRAHHLQGLDACSASTDGACSKRGIKRRRS